MKRILMLGAGNCQLNAIHKIKSLGYQAIVSDPYENSKGKKFSDISILADTFSYKDTFEKTKNLNIDGIMTSGTDQPVLTVAKLSEAFDLPVALSSEVAFNVTNKKAMKAIFKKHKIPSVDYVILKESYQDEDIYFSGPYVLKPIDSQGQRGIFKVDSKKDIRMLFHQVLEHSRADEILVEAYYKNRELTVSGWVHKSSQILTVTDRVTFSSDEHIGVCIAHEYPSIHLNKYSHEIEEITSNICKAFNIDKGPIYFQYLVGEDGIMVNEIACRLGGAYEDVTIPFITGFDILQATIDLALGLNQRVNIDKAKDVFSTQLFFCKPGRITDMTPIDLIKNLPYVLDAGYNYNIGDEIGAIENASQRAGYVVITGKDEASLVENINNVYDRMLIVNRNENLVIRGKRYYR